MASRGEAGPLAFSTDSSRGGEVLTRATYERSASKRDAGSKIVLTILYAIIFLLLAGAVAVSAALVALYDDVANRERNRAFAQAALGTSAAALVLLVVAVIFKATTAGSATRVEVERERLRR